MKLRSSGSGASTSSLTAQFDITGYRILIEASRKIEQATLAKLPSLLFELTPEDVDKAFADYLKARFPFSYKMKFIAERFGALPRGKTMGPERLAELPSRFAKTPIYDETIRETMLEKVDVPTVKKMMQSVIEGKTKVSTLLRLQKPTPLGYRILARYAEVPELMATERVLLSNNIECMKQSTQARRPSLLCLNCDTNHSHNYPQLAWTTPNKPWPTAT